MKVTVLTSTQVTEVASLQGAVASARTILQTAQQALNSYLTTVAKPTVGQRLQVTSDGITVVTLP